MLQTWVSDSERSETSIQDLKSPSCRVVTETTEVGEMSQGKSVKSGRLQTCNSVTDFFLFSFLFLHGRAILKTCLKHACLNLAQAPARPLIFYPMLLSLKLLAWPLEASSLRPVYGSHVVLDLGTIYTQGRHRKRKPQMREEGTKQLGGQVCSAKERFSRTRAFQL